jgi:hypothetical protein
MRAPAPDRTEGLEHERSWPVRYSWVVIAISGILVAGVLGIAVVRPETFAEGISQLHGKERADTLASARDFALKLATGIGAIAAALLAWGRFELAKEERDVARLTLDAARITANADRFARAVDQVGSDKGLDAVLGGLYALEALAVSAHDYQRQIKEVLCAFVRQRLSDQSSRPLTVADHAALTILRRNRTWVGHVDFSGADLSQLDLRGMHLYHANLTKARLRGANMESADLTRAILIEADLARANLSGALLYEANLTNAKLLSADLAAADLAGADLSGSDLRNVDLAHTRLLAAAWRRDDEPKWPDSFEIGPVSDTDVLGIPYRRFSS